MGDPSRLRAQTDLHRGAIVWFTGLSGAGKTAVAELVQLQLLESAIRSVVLDGDSVRRGLNRDLGFSLADRTENVRRVAELAKLLADEGLVVLVALISPLRKDRELARSIAGERVFVEVYVDAPLATVEQRDVKGLYARARVGDLPMFTGVSSPYEAPENPDVRLDTSGRDSPDVCAAEVTQTLQRLVRR